MNIIIGLTEHIGDIIACEPVARYLRAKFPQARISWVVLQAYRDLVDGNPNVDETVTVDCLTDWIKLTKHKSYDMVIDLHVNYRVCSHCRIPLMKQHGNPLVNAYEWFDHGALLEAFSLGAGLPKLSAQPNMYIGPSQTKAVDALQLPAGYCVIHRESNNVDKDWTAANWLRFAEWIRDELNIPIVEIGASSLDLPSPLAGIATNLINKTSILETAEVIRRARFFVGIDSGPSHMANAVRTPGVVMLGRLNVFRQYMPYTGFYASEAPEVKIVRNLNGPARETQLEDVIGATRYVAKILEYREAPRAKVTANVDPIVLPMDDETEEHARDRARVLASDVFDPAWYSIQYPDASKHGTDLLDHFLTTGGALGYSPGPDFDSKHYLKVNPDVLRSGMNPLLHYIHFGKKEGRNIKPVAYGCEDGVWTDVARESVREASAAYTPRLSASLDTETDLIDDCAAAAKSGVSALPRTFAFYLPQFHPIAENNLAHGAGFTEWTNVIKTEPLFKGHYQPRIPGELGYYDLRSLETMREQVRLAVEHGITGFCFYYYYFHGKKLLYRPIENYISSDIEAPFFFLWANENWSKRWDGGNDEVIIAQEHSDEDDLAFLRELITTFQDKRYVKIDGKPILLVYKTHLFPDILRTTETWRAEIERHGFPGIYLVMVDDWIPDPIHPRMLGFDASYEIPSNVVPLQTLSAETEALDLGDDFSGRIVDYQKFAHYHMSRPFPEHKRFRTVMLPWDNTPRYGSRAMVHINTSGDGYKLWLAQAMLDTSTRYAPEEQIVFLHSWNEWCEGTYLEPDGKYGRAFLEQTKEAVSEVRSIMSLVESPEGRNALLKVRAVQQKKDEWAFRVMQATRMQSGHLYGELERTRAKLSQAESDAREEVESVANERLEIERTREAIRVGADEEEKLRAAEIQRLRLELAAIRSSTSWRITAPLRSIIGALRKA